MDELYFVINFESLLTKLEIEGQTLKNELEKLINLDWVKILDEDMVHQLEYDSLNFDKNFNRYCYLATKKGLFAHNSN